MKQRFCKGKLYHFAGLRWDHRAQKTVHYETVIVGDLVRSHVDPIARTHDCKGEFTPDGRVYRVDDGHLPDCQPRVSAEELPALMGAQKIRFAFPVAS